MATGRLAFTIERTLFCTEMAKDWGFFDSGDVSSLNLLVVKCSASVIGTR